MSVFNLSRWRFCPRFAGTTATISIAEFHIQSEGGTLLAGRRASCRCSSPLQVALAIGRHLRCCGTTMKTSAARERSRERAPRRRLFAGGAAAGDRRKTTCSPPARPLARARTRHFRKRSLLKVRSVFARSLVDARVRPSVFFFVVFV